MSKRRRKACKSRVAFQPKSEPNFVAAPRHHIEFAKPNSQSQTNKAHIHTHTHLKHDNTWQGRRFSCTTRDESVSCWTFFLKKEFGNIRALLGRGWPPVLARSKRGEGGSGFRSAFLYSACNLNSN